MGSLLDRSTKGEAQAILITGDAGVGKTALVTRSCADRGETSTVLFGASLPLTSMSIPFLAIRSAVRGVAGTAGVVSDVRGDEPEFPLRFDAWLDVRCAEKPVILVVDDLQWADSSTLDALMYVIAGPADRPLAVVATLRSGEIGSSHPLERWLADIRRLPRVTQLVLGPLDRAGTATQLELLVGAVPHQSLVDDVFRRTHGNPYFTRLMVAGLRAEARSAPQAFPTDLRSAVLQPWFQLSTPARRVAEILAVGGRAMHPDELAEVIGESTGLVTARLHEAVASGTVEMDEDGAYWFHHPLNAEMLEAELVDQDRRDLHRRFADMTERRDLEQRLAVGEPGSSDAPSYVSSAVAIADHRFAAGQMRDAFDWALIAADAAGATVGSAERVRLLMRAAEMIGFASESVVSLESVLWRLRKAAADAGLFVEELASVEQLIELVNPLEAPLVSAELLVRRSSLRFSTGREFSMIEDLREAVRLATTYPASPEYVIALAELSRAELWRASPQAEEHARDAVARARQIGDRRALAYALTAQSMTAEAAGDDASARSLAEEAIAHASSAGDWWAYERAVLRIANSVAAWSTDSYASTISEYRMEMGSRGAPHPYLAWLSAVEAAAWLVIGQLHECRQRLRVALGSNPGPLADAQARLVAARLATLQGRQSEAEGHLARADELFVDGSAFLALEFDAVRSEVRLGARDWIGAHQAAMTGLASVVAPVMSEWLAPLAARALNERITAARDAGDESEVTHRAVEQLAADFPRIRRNVGPEVEKWRVQNAALEALYQAELSRARAHEHELMEWLAAADACAVGRLAWEEAYARWRAAEYALGRGRDRRGGAEQLRLALQLSVRLGARPIEGELRDLARRARIPVEEPRAAASEEPAALHGLTEREREVLDLIAVGRTYFEIARTLMVSEKTVSTHVSHLLAKTGTANRVELAGLVHRIAADRDPTC